MRVFYPVFVFFLVGQILLAQNQPAIYLNNHTLYPVLINNGSRNTVDWPSNNCENGQCFAIIQFADVLNDEQKIAITELGISLHQYIPEFAYIASAAEDFEENLPDYVLALEAILPSYKRPIVPLSVQTTSENEAEYHLKGVPFSGISPQQLAQHLALIGATTTAIHEDYIQFKLAQDDLQTILSSPLLKYVENVAPKPFTEGRSGRINGRVNKLNKGFGMGYDGSNVNIAIADDGPIDHIDFSGRVTDFTNFHTGNHADMTAGMAMGGGIIDPLATGMAPGAHLFLYDISDYGHILNATSNYYQHRIVVTSTSFGEGCGDPYGTSAYSIDNQVFNTPYVLHCFSAGNHGTNPCFNNYGLLGSTFEGYYFSNITGGRKAAKNVLAIGNNSYDDLLRLSSSRGPTPDGRIKPDITAMGQGDWTTNANNQFRYSSGTSSASPNIAGISADLIQFYRSMHNDNDPFSSLIKAVLLNGAEDLGLPGPDYSFGWGRVNANRSLRMLEENTYFEQSINHNATNNHQISIPFGAQQVKIMVYWHDPAGSLLASKALVNDLDLTVTTPSGTKLLPWTPSFAQNLDSLTMPAQHRVDRVNNVEQIVINNPSAGLYQINIKGYQVPKGPQAYTLVYDIETDPITVSFPCADATLVPNEENVISWDAHGNNGSFLIQYSTNGLSNWQTIANNIPGNIRHFLWNTPNTISHNLYVRITRNGYSAISDGPAVICEAPSFELGFSDDNHAEVSWNSVPGAIKYEVLWLVGTHLQVATSTNGLSAQIPVSLNQDYWVTVRAVLPNNKKGRRAIAKKYHHFGCAAQYTLTIQFDQYPQENSWLILNASGESIMEGGPYISQVPHSQISVPICLPNECYTFIMYDSYNDGLCCNNGNGWYRLSGQNGEELIHRSSFGGLAYNLFCPAPIPNSLTINLEGIYHVSCYGGQDGAAQIFANGGSGNYSYQWSTGATSQGVTYLSAGTHSVTVSDGTENKTLEFVINQPNPLAIVSTSQTAFCNDGTINLTATGGTSPYSISWGDGNFGWSRTSLSAGNYYALVSDAKGCLSTKSVDVNQGQAIQLDLLVNQPDCSSTSGSILAQATGGHGGYNYVWNNGQTQAFINNLPEGLCVLTVTDQGGCQTTASAQINTAPSLNIVTQFTHPSCFGLTNGSLSASTSGGTPPYSYAWSNGSFGATLFNLSAGAYTLTVTDGLGCSTTRNYQLSQPTATQMQISATPANNFAGGTIDLVLSGGTPPYQVIWNNGFAGTNLVNLPAGYYTATVSDAQGCHSYISIEVDFEDVTELDYCDVQASSTTYEWIESIIINNVLNQSGNDGGYGDYTSISVPVIIGEEMIINAHPAYLLANYNETWRIWIDFNRDGDFADNGEEVFTTLATSGATTINIPIPTNTFPGETRMRIAMQYSSAPILCQNLNYGEVEDYTIYLITNENATAGTLRPQTPDNIFSTNTTKWAVSPNPVTGAAFLNGSLNQDDVLVFQIIDNKGQFIKQWNSEAPKGRFREELQLRDLPTGLYFIKVSNHEWQEVVRFVKM